MLNAQCLPPPAYVLVSDYDKVAAFDSSVAERDAAASVQPDKAGCFSLSSLVVSTHRMVQT